MSAKNKSQVRRWLDAVSSGNLAAVSVLVKEKMNLNVAAPDGRTALMFAAAAGNAPMLRLLIEAGAEVNARTNSGKTALGYCLNPWAEGPPPQEGASTLESLKVLLAARASITEEVVQCALLYGSTEVMEILLKYKSGVLSRADRIKEILSSCEAWAFDALNREEFEHNRELLQAHLRNLY